MENSSLSVRAVDVGYGHIKFTTGRDPITRTITTDSIPSQSPAAKQQTRIAGGVLKQRDTFIVPIGERQFEVGRDIRLALLLDGNFRCLLNPDCPLANFYKFEAIPERFL